MVDSDLRGKTDAGCQLISQCIRFRERGTRQSIRTYKIAKEETAGRSPGLKSSALGTSQ